jgi:hypothetical protein
MRLRYPDKEENHKTLFLKKNTMLNDEIKKISKKIKNNVNLC